MTCILFVLKYAYISHLLCTCRFFGVVLIFVDVSLVILSLLIDEERDTVESMIANLSLSIALFFFVDVLLRVFIEG